MCSRHFRREDSRNYLNGRIPERCFCFKFALSVLLPRKGTKHSRERVNPPSRLLKQSLGALRDTCAWNVSTWRGRMFSRCSWSCVQEFEQCHKVAIFGKPLALLVYLETLRQVAKIDHAQGQIQWFPARTFSLLLIFLVSDSSSVSIFSTLWSRDCSSNRSLSSGSYMVSQATLVDLTGDCYCCVSFTLVTSYCDILRWFDWIFFWRGGTSQVWALTTSASVKIWEKDYHNCII